MKARLSPLSARTDLTDRECCKIIGGTIGGLIDLAGVENVRNAVKWWAESTDAWKAFGQYKDAQSALAQRATKK